MSAAHIGRESLPDHDGTPIDVMGNVPGLRIGVLTIEKGTSRLELRPGQLPHRRWPLKRKHRQR